MSSVRACFKNPDCLFSSSKKGQKFEDDDEGNCSKRTFKTRSAEIDGSRWQNAIAEVRIAGLEEMLNQRGFGKLLDASVRQSHVADKVVDGAVPARIIHVRIERSDAHDVGRLAILVRFAQQVAVPGHVHVGPALIRLSPD